MSAEILDPNSERGQQAIRNAAYLKPTTQGDPPPRPNFDGWANDIGALRENVGFDNYTALIAEALTTAYEQGHQAALVTRPEPRAQEPQWLPIDDAPRNGLRFRARLADGSEREVQWAPFDGWRATEDWQKVEPTHWLSVAVRPASAPELDYVEVLKSAKAIVNASVLYKKFINGTPLENDIAVWMADFVFEQLRGRVDQQDG
jgi:hypothetical protein